MRKLNALSVATSSVEMDIDQIRRSLEQTVPGIQESDIVSIQIEKAKAPVATVDEHGKKCEKEHVLWCFYWA